MARNSSVQIGGIQLENPLIAGAGEHTIEAAGVGAALEAGAGAVVVKSGNESATARAQLDQSDYLLLDSHWRPLPWSFDAPRDASLFCRSGLSPLELEDWLES